MPPVNPFEQAETEWKRNLLQRATPRHHGKLDFLEWLGESLRLPTPLSRQPRCWLDAFLVFVDALPARMLGVSPLLAKARYANEIRDRSTLL